MSLLEIVDMKTNKSPIMISTPIAEELDGPFLVSSSKGSLWVDNKFPGNFIRSATRVEKPTSEIYKGCVEQILTKSLELSWGSVQEYSKQGLEQALHYMSYYGFEECDLLMNDEDKSLGHESIDGLYYSWVSWVPKGLAVLVPVDRSYLGTLYTFGAQKYSFCVHNPSRGICVLRN